MKKFYSLLFALFITTTATAQLQTQITSAGVFKITYGAANDYSFYDPGFGVPTFYVHCFVNAADNTAGTAFEDAWSNSTVTMNWDTTAGAYVGNIDLNSKTFTQTNVKIPVGTTVNKIGMVFKDLQSGATKQSTDFYANGPTTIITLGVSTSAVKAKSSIINGQLRTALARNLSLEIYEMGGKLVRSLKANSNGNAIDLNINKSGIYLLKITNGSESEVVKFAK